MAAPPSFASITERKTEDTPLRVVHIDGHVVLKIAKHSKEGMPTLVTGQLLGLDVGQTLEVTDCFPFPVLLPPSVPIICSARMWFDSMPDSSATMYEWYLLCRRATMMRMA